METLRSSSAAPLLRVCRSLRPLRSIRRSEEEPHPHPGDARVHDLEHAVERRRPGVVLLSEDGVAVEQIEDVEVEREIRLRELEHLLGPEVERAHRVEAELI